MRERRRYRSSLVSYRMALGKRINDFLSSEEAKRNIHKNNKWVIVCEHFGVLRSDKAAWGRRKKWMMRVHQEWTKHHDAVQRQGPRHRYRSLPAWNRVSDVHRKRKRCFQGRPEKMPDLSYLLYQWFVDQRSEMAGRIRQRRVLSQARSILGSISVENVAEGLVPDVPVLDNKWLTRWRLRWGVSLKKPSQRFKVKRAVLKARLLIYWANVLIVRWFFWKLFGVHVMHEQYDQKGVHMNEAGSKQVSTLEMPGRIDIPLKENFHQTRERISWMTATFSNLQRAGRKIPLDIMFKAKGKKNVDALTLPDNKRYTLTTSPSGSYRTEHVVEFLQTHLAEWSEERHKAMDWRILGLDAYAAHKSDAIADVAWSHGYLYHEGLMVPGGATGVVQGPDTDLHAWLEAELIELQSISQHEKLSVRPSRTPTETRQDMVDGSTSLWEAADHEQGEHSFKRNGLDNALDGSEDNLITRTAKEFWFECNMPVVREQCQLEVEEFLKDKPDAEVKDVFSLLRGYDNVKDGIGYMDEGQEIEESLHKGEKPYLEDDDKSVSDDDDSEGDDSGDQGHDGNGVPRKEGQDGNGVPHMRTDNVMATSCLQIPQSEVSDDVENGAMEEEKAKDEDPLEQDLRHLKVMLALSNDMRDKSVKGMLQRHTEALLRVMRHGDVQDRKGGISFLQRQKTICKSNDVLLG